MPVPEPGEIHMISKPVDQPSTRGQSRLRTVLLLLRNYVFPTSTISSSTSCILDLRYQHLADHAYRNALLLDLQSNAPIAPRSRISMQLIRARSLSVNDALHNPSYAYRKNRCTAAFKLILWKGFSILGFCCTIDTSSMFHVCLLACNRFKTKLMRQATRATVLHPVALTMF